MVDIKSDLPVYDYNKQITSLVDENQVTIITAETGAGKSTQVPQYLAAHGYDKVVVTQPRILAARNLKRRVSEEWGERGGHPEDIGYRTSSERDDTPDSKILYCTDGLQLVREITGSGTKKSQVLVLDEVHEWNENMEVLIAWAKLRAQQEPSFKIVIMSATIETGDLAKYFSTDAILNVPGRYHEVSRRRGTDVITEIARNMVHKSNMLVFLPGKTEIYDVAEAIKEKAYMSEVPIIPLHSQLEATAQQEAFASYPNGKIILATNIAQTSVTIDDIDVVIDSGLARQSEVRRGVEGLFMVQTSQADCLQRAGRAGRTKSGEYILAQYDDLECLDFDDRPKYPVPEILRKHIDRVALRLASVDIDIATLEFFHSPKHKSITTAKRTLIELGALSKTGEITKIGRQMEKFPVESMYGRMLVESKQYSDEVRSKLAAIIGIQEVGGIVRGGRTHTGWRKLTKQKNSDLLAEYDVLLSLDDYSEDEYEDLGIIPKNVDKAKEVYERLVEELSLARSSLTLISSDEQDQLMRCIIAGQLNLLWMINDKGEAIHISKKKRRELSSSTVVKNPKLIAATPFDLQVPMRGRLQTLHIVQGITRVDTKWLRDLAPHIFTAKKPKTEYNPRSGKVEKYRLVRFGKHVLEGLSDPVVKDNKQNRQLFTEQFAKWLYGKLEKERRNIGRYYSKRIPSIPKHVLEADVKSIADDIVSLDQATPEQRKALMDLGHLSSYLGESYMSQINRNFRQRKMHHKHRDKRQVNRKKHLKYR